jgi:hypothetical protein
MILSEEENLINMGSFKKSFRRYAKSRKVAESNPNDIIGFSFGLILSAALWPKCRLSL